VALFLDICKNYPKIGYPVCAFLKKHYTPELFALIGNNPFSLLYSKIASTAVKAATYPAFIAVGTDLIVDYGVSTTGLHQLAAHAAQDFYNGHKTVYTHKPEFNRSPYLDKIVDSVFSNKK